MKSWLRRVLPEEPTGVSQQTEWWETEGGRENLYRATEAERKKCLGELQMVQKQIWDRVRGHCYKAVREVRLHRL